MQNKTAAFLIVLMFCVHPILGIAIGAQPEHFITPAPQSYKLKPGEFSVSPTTRIVFDKRDAPREIECSLEPLARVLAEEIEILGGFRPTVLPFDSAKNPNSGDIRLKFAKIDGKFAATEDAEDQSYALTTSANGGVEISGQYYKGVAYGTVTLLQLLKKTSVGFTSRNVRIGDGADLPYRTLMIDIARQKHSVGALQQVIRLARMYKIRYLQIHLTDDQNFVFPFKPVTDHLEKNYTISREEWIDLVAFADSRGVTLIPELDLPGHSTKLRASGYLGEAKTDADVASPNNFEKIQAIVDDMLDVFHSSPYFHIGGDESRAGSALVPFLAAMNAHLRGKPADQRRRMVVWEGFHGAPESIPATGDDRVIVISWESSYNPPWSLLKSGYSIVNGCWKPLYLVGRGTPRHPGASTRMWPPETIYGWDANTFMHWQPGCPVFEDAGPNDTDLEDAQWQASNIDRESQVIGGQMLLWEQVEQWVIQDLSTRLPVFAERLWNPDPKLDYDSFAKRQSRVNDRIFTLLRPVKILPHTIDSNSPASLDYRIYEGDSVSIEMKNRSGIKGTIRYEVGKFNDDVTYIYSSTTPPPTDESAIYTSPLKLKGGFSIRAGLFRENGESIGGTTWQVYNNWPQRVEVTDFKTGKRHLEDVPDLEQREPDQRLRTVQLPMLRGPYTHVDNRLQMTRTVLNVPATGEYTIAAKTQSGRATVYLDLNQNGEWDQGEAIIENTPRTEKPQSKVVSLTAGKYNLRVDHAAALVRPVLVLFLDGPGTDGKKEISKYLSLPDQR